jgi:hypothetical protein
MVLFGSLRDKFKLSIEVVLDNRLPCVRYLRWYVLGNHIERVVIDVVRWQARWCNGCYIAAGIVATNDLCAAVW